jgi:tRNA modification GTPase
MGDRPTIFALSSAPGRAAIAVVRVSGTRAGAVIDQMAPPRPIDRMSGVRRIRHPESGETLDQGVIIWLAGPKTDTSEDIAEFHVHGGTAIVRSVLSAIGSLPGCRLAEPGEFTRRAFENGKIDLAQAEARADLVDAETEAQRRQALRQMSGALSSLYDGWRSQMIEASSLVEAAIDFSDELDVANVALDRSHELARNLRAAIAAHLEDGNRGEILRLLGVMRRSFQRRREQHAMSSRFASTWTGCLSSYRIRPAFATPRARLSAKGYAVQWQARAMPNSSFG